MATEQLYRRGQDGLMERVVPEARGKAAAFDTWMAQGGGDPQRMGRGGKFHQGPMKGMTLDQAKQAFEAKWATVGDDVKEKYAGRANTDLAPSEARSAQMHGIEPTPATSGPNQPKKDMSAAGMQQRRMASYGYEFNKDGVAVPIGTKSNTVPSFKALPTGKSKIVQGPPVPTASTTPKTVAPPVKQNAQASNTFAPGSDQARAAALTENSRNERYATADNGGAVSDAAAVAAKGDIGNRIVQGVKDTASKFFDPDTINNTNPDGTRKDRLPVGDSGRPGSSSVVQGPPFLGVPSTTPKSAVAYPVAAQSTAPSPSRTRAQNIAAAGGDVSKLSTDDRMVAQGKINGGPTPVVKAPTQTIAPPEKTLTPGVKPAPINRLTGLPMGYQPGDTLDAKATDSTRAAASASVARQIAADPRMQPGSSDIVQGPSNKPMTGSVPVAGAPRAIPVTDPLRPNSPTYDPVTPKPSAIADVASPDAKMRAMSPEELEKASGRKFYTGKIKPLGQASGYRNANPV